MEALFKMNVDCGRMGNLEGVFVAEKEDIDYMVENKVGIYFGEVLGKHSEISGYIDSDEIKLITADENVIKIFKENDIECGYNPLKQTFSIGDTDSFEEPEDSPIEWDNCMVQEYIDFKRKSIIPEYYNEEYLAWVENNSEK